MDNFDLIKHQEKILNDLRERQKELEGKFSAKGFVVAGYGGDTYYAYIGEGRGFGGAALAPISWKPVIFDTQEAARKEAYNGTYRNGANELIRLKVIGASHYFRTIHGIIEKNIRMIKEQFDNKQG